METRPARMKLFFEWKEPRLTLKKLGLTRWRLCTRSVRMPYRRDCFCGWAGAQLEPGLKQSSAPKSLLPLTSPDSGHKLCPCVGVSQWNHSCQTFTVVLFPGTLGNPQASLLIHTVPFSQAQLSPMRKACPAFSPSTPTRSSYVWNTHFICTSFIQIGTSNPVSGTGVHAWLPLPGWEAGRQDPGPTEAFLKTHWNAKPKKWPGEEKEECGDTGNLWSNSFER